MKNSNVTKVGYVVGAISVGSFLVCSVWGVFLPSVALKELHFLLLQLVYPGFAFTAIGYAVGILEAFVYGWIIGASFVWLHKKICTHN
ncbi:MAG: hypothetical protein JKX80_01445 [Candidatus Pacebacteria bacterium]|nr:hypothetical protein [Candidatus Paceibacterota bacterium]